MTVSAPVAQPGGVVGQISYFGGSPSTVDDRDERHTCNYFAFSPHFLIMFVSVFAYPSSALR